MPPRTQLPTKVKEAKESDGEDDDVVAIPAPDHIERPLLHPRIEVDVATAKFRQNAVHVYGLDYLKNEHVKEIFNQFHHKFIEWINESSANIIFAKPEDAAAALKSLSYAKPDDEPWRRTPDILVHEGKPAIFLQLRLAASTDVKKPKRGVPKVTAEDMLGTRRRRPKGPGGGNEKAGGEAGATSGTKRPRIPATPEEQEKRQKRAARFGEWLEEVASARKAEAAAANAAAAAAAAGTEGQDATKTPDEEEEKRQKRAARFGEWQGKPPSNEEKAKEKDNTPATEEAAADAK